MNEFQFTKACIKVFGLVVLILGVIGLLANGFITAFTYIKQIELMDAASAMSGGSDSMHAMLEQTFKRTMISHYSRMIGDAIKIMAGLFLCRRYTKLARWISKDDATAAVSS